MQTGGGRGNGAFGFCKDGLISANIVGHWLALEVRWKWDLSDSLYDFREDGIEVPGEFYDEGIFLNTFSFDEDAFGGIVPIDFQF